MRKKDLGELEGTTTQINALGLEAANISRLHLVFLLAYSKRPDPYCSQQIAQSEIYLH